MVITLTSVPGIPMVRPGDDLAALLHLAYRGDVPAHRADRSALILVRVRHAQARRIGERPAGDFVGAGAHGCGSASASSSSTRRLVCAKSFAQVCTP